ncbi:MAG: glutathione S-transferase N-terminal domain-containing protein [Burkholderiales bacterium]|nr:glutathione S-transferase N-terminal domain-containing protein [Burkholderiales bacterium]
MKLLGTPASPYTRKVRVALAEKRLPCEFVTVDVAPPDSAVNAYNPLGKVPTLVLDDGTVLFDSRVIVEYLEILAPEMRLIPEEGRARVAVRRWEALADGALDAGVLIRYESQRPEREQSAAWLDKQKGKLERALETMARELGERPWCHGERYSLADIAVGCCLGWVEFRKPAGIEWRGRYPNLARLYDRLNERPAFAETVPR